MPFFAPLHNCGAALEAFYHKALLLAQGELEHLGGGPGVCWSDVVGLQGQSI